MLQARFVVLHCAILLPHVPLPASAPPEHPTPLGFIPFTRYSVFHADAHVVFFADNWLLRADQRTLVLTDFGAAVDALRPNRRMSLPWPAAPIPQPGAAAATNATGPGEATFASLTSGPCQNTGAASSDAAVAAAAAAGDRDGAAGSASGDAEKETVPTPTTARCQPAEERVLSVTERFGLTGTTSSRIEGDGDVSAASPARKRRRHCGDEESGGGRVDIQGGDKQEVSSRRLSDKLLVPFSKYCVAGTPSIVAPELARAWREENDLDFRRSDVSLCLLSGFTREHSCVPYRPERHHAPLP